MCLSTFGVVVTSNLGRGCSIKRASLLLGEAMLQMFGQVLSDGLWYLSCSILGLDNGSRVKVRDARLALGVRILARLVPLGKACGVRVMIPLSPEMAFRIILPGSQI